MTLFSVIDVLFLAANLGVLSANLYYTRKYTKIRDEVSEICERGNQVLVDVERIQKEVARKLLKIKPNAFN